MILLTSRSLGPPLPTPLLGAASSNPSDSADGMSYPAREEKLRCYVSEQDDSNGTISSSGKSKFSTNTQKSCDLSQVLPKALKQSDPGNPGYLFPVWAPLQLFRLFRNVQATKAQMQFSQIETWLPISAGHFSEGSLASQAYFLTAHLLVLKRNLLVIGRQYIFICQLLCTTLHKQLKNCFTVFSKRQKTIIALLKVAVLFYPKLRFPVRITCWCSYEVFPVFQTITSSFSERHSPFFHLWICWANFKVKNTFHCTEFESRHRNSAWCHPFVPETHMCKRRTRICEMLQDY